MSARNRRVNEMITEDIEKAVLSGTAEMKKTIEERIWEILTAIENETIDKELLFKVLSGHCRKNAEVKSVERIFDYTDLLFGEYSINSYCESFFEEDIYNSNWFDYWSENSLLGHYGFLNLAVGDMMEVMNKSKNDKGRTYLIFNEADTTDGTDEIELYFYGRDLPLQMDYSFRFCKRNENEDKRQDLAYVQTYIGKNIASGRLGKEEIDNAREWFRKAADNGSEDATLCLVDLVLNRNVGEGAGRDVNQTINILEEFAREGDTNALVILGKIYFYGDCCEKNIPKALNYFQQAVEKDNDEALLFMGSLYLDGYEVEQNGEKGLSYIERVAERGDIRAIMACGMTYIEGKNVATDVNKGMKYIRRAAMMGDEMAMNLLKEMSSIED